MTDVVDQNASDELHPAERPLRRFVVNNRAALGSLAVFVVMMAIFITAVLVMVAMIAAWTLWTLLAPMLPG